MSPGSVAPPRADAAVVEAVRAGDESAIVELVRTYHRPLIRLAQTWGVSAAVAEDLVQETWLAVITGIDRFEGRSSLRTWIFRILANRTRTRAARERRTVPLSAIVERELGGWDAAVDRARFAGPGEPVPLGHWTSPPPAWGSDVERRLLGHETMRVVAAALDRLPPAQRTVMTLRDVEGWPSEDVRAALGISAGNQRVLLHRARSRVRQALEDELDLTRNVTPTASSETSRP
jgi:RNA polymerase sigma-70 factor (ECF subfamily)